MNDLSSKQDAVQFAQPLKTTDWRRAMSNHVAYALLVYTGLQIFMPVKALAEGWFERRWTLLSDEEASNPDHASDFRRDAIALWALAIGLPFALTAMIKGVFAFA